MKEKINIFWFRRDLRLDDNIGLHRALKSGQKVLPLFIFDSNILKRLHNPKDKRVQFIHDTLRKLKEELNTLGSDLYIISDEPTNAFESIIKDFEISSVYSNEDYEPYALNRDQKIRDLLNENNIDFYQFKDQCIFSKNDILKNDGKPYTVYTPYKNKWRETLTEKDYASISNLDYYSAFLKIKDLYFPELEEIGFEEVSYSTNKTVFKKSELEVYHETRNIPSLDSTTRISIHLRFGTISVRKCVQIGLLYNQTWVDELIWREFFMQILFHFPHVEKSSFKEKYDRIPWQNDKTLFKLWCEGRTGYPLVDAGMRELNQTGFMHNRVRMITASFLIKHLLIDWRWGEAYFAEKLLDYDLALNNGNWQWVAGTGCDAAPYFRIFNPESQRKKFDSQDEYIKRWLPEFGTTNYPSPIIEHKKAYQRALITYKNALN